MALARSRLTTPSPRNLRVWKPATIFSLLTLLLLAACTDDSTTPTDRSWPGAIEDLVAFPVGDSAVALTWSAPGDDGNVGRAAVYDLRFSQQPPLAATWWGEETVPVDSVPAPAEAFSEEHFTVRGLPPAEEYFFGLRSADEEGNESPTSNIAWVQMSCPVSVTATPLPIVCEGDTLDVAWSSEGCGNRTLTVELAHGAETCRILAVSSEDSSRVRLAAVPCEDEVVDHVILVRDVLGTIVGAVESPVSIVRGCEVEVLSPVGGEYLCLGLEATIRWAARSCCGDTVRIELLRNGEVCSTLAEAAPNTGQFQWTAQGCPPAVNGYRIRVSPRGQGNAGLSPASFGIHEPGQLQVLGPVSGESFLEDETVPIRWSSDECLGPVVRLEILHDGSPCQLLAVANSGAYDWVADTCSGLDSGYRVRITDYTTGAVAQGEGTFSVIGTCHLTVNATERSSYCAGSTMVIRWDRDRYCDTGARIDLVGRRGEILHEVTAITHVPGRYEWIVDASATPGVEYRVRVTELSSGAYANAPNTFIITTPRDRIHLRPGGSGDFATIQEAVLASCEGTEIILADGIYSGRGNRDIDPQGHDFTLRSESGNRLACIIDCGGSSAEPHHAIQASLGESIVLEGITIQGAWGNAEAPVTVLTGDLSLDNVRMYGNQGNSADAILAYAANVEITGSEFVANDPTGQGYAINVWRGTATVSETLFDRNGSGMTVRSTETPAVIESCQFRAHPRTGIRIISDVAIEDCVFRDNGVGIQLNELGNPRIEGCLLTRCDDAIRIGSSSEGHGGSAEIRNCTIARCSTNGEGTALWIGGVGWRSTLTRCIFYGNGTAGNDPIIREGDATIELICSDMFGNPGGDWVGAVASQGGENGNFSESPRFCDQSTYLISASSPCAPDGVCGELVGSGPVGCGLVGSGLGGRQTQDLR